MSKIATVIRADTMLDKGDVEGCAARKRPPKAMEKLQRESPGDSERHH
jgi:hypothetical protein